VWDRKNQSIRTGSLKPLRVFQCMPINLVFCQGFNTES